MGRMASQEINGFEGQSLVQSSVHNFFSIGSVEGYSGTFSDALLLEIRQNEDVDFVEYDQVMKAFSPIISERVARTSATWGLQRISQRESLPVGPNATLTAKKLDYVYNANPSELGKGSNVYVLDTGIFLDHQEFNGKAVWGTTTAWFSTDADLQGHGTHCSGSIAGDKYGVAPEANLTAVKVLGDDGSGMTSWIIKGIQWVVKQNTERRIISMR
jgi:subtilisin family serine protease